MPLGLPSQRIDVLTRITGIDFEDAWRDRVEQVLGGYSIAYLRRTDLVANKHSTACAQDLADVPCLKIRLTNAEPAIHRLLSPRSVSATPHLLLFR